MGSCQEIQEGQDRLTGRQELGPIGTEKHGQVPPSHRFPGYHQVPKSQLPRLQTDSRPLQGLGRQEVLMKL